VFLLSRTQNSKRLEKELLTYNAAEKYSLGCTGRSLVADLADSLVAVGCTQGG
jgi:hypothetical protein